MRRVVEQDDAARERRSGLEYDLSLKTERLDAAGKVLKTKLTRAVARPRRDVSFATELTPDPGASAEAQANARQEMQESQRLQAVMRLRRLADHFAYRIEGSATVDGRDCWVLAFFPRSGAPAATREEKVVNGLRGRFWIEKSTASVAQSEGALAAPVSLGFFVTMNQLAFRYRAQALPKGELAPASFGIEVNVSAPLYSFRQRQSSTMENYRPAATR